MAEKDLLLITFEKPKEFKTKFGRWWYWKIWFPVWFIFRPRVLSKFYWCMSELSLRMLPKAEREKVRKEMEEWDVMLVNETDDENLTEHIISELKKNYDVEVKK